jgi:hypothetical protein
MANLINEAEIRSTWAPVIEEATGINDSNKLAWMSTYCHNHKLYEDANIMSLGSVGSFNSMNIGGMGAVTLPDTTAGFDAQRGSGDKAPTLLPLAMQVAAQTIGLDLVPVIPMAGPMGLLSYLDFVYEGGRLDNDVTPTYVKVSGTNLAVGNDGGTPAADYAALVGTSRLDGVGIYKITEAGEAAVAGGDTIADLFTGTAISVSLVAALNDHIPGFSGNEDANGDLLNASPFSREVGERTPDNIMGLSLFSKSVEAETFQVAAAVTREQVQDLKQFGVDAVAQVEAVLTNELTQSINSYILGTMRSMAESGLSTLALDYTQGGNTYGDVNRRILTHILAAANLIANRGRRGAGNFAVVDAKVASALQGVAGFVPNPMANTISQVAGAIYPVGSVAGINIYTDPRLPFEGGYGSLSANEHEILVGRKGDGNGAGLVFMPYLMAESVQTIAEGTMAPKVAVKSRFALVKAGFHPETQYQKFTVSGLAL